MSVTLKEIAKKAQVSISTVSRVINNDTNKPASKETQDKVWKIVRELGYVPNQNARNLIKGQESIIENTNTRAIGCIFTSTKDTYNDPFFSQIARGIQDEVSKRGYILGYSFSSCDMSFSSLYNNLTSNPVDGAVILGRFSEDVLNFLKQNIKNIVYTGVNYVDAGFDEVICDGYKGAMAAVEYLISLNHRDIGFIGSTKELENVVNEHRYEGYLDTMNKQEIPVKKEYIQDVELSTADGFTGMDNMIKRLGRDKLPTAIFCANDLVAIGAMKALHKNNIKVPEDISIIGLDDIELSEYVTPGLTTIKVPKVELGKFAVKMLIDKIENGHTLPVRVNVPFTIIERESCRAIN
ncbi:LacI family DNA-binding transcriptional regulator [Vallitalea guaymasensis]|uniref:LacI family DNA-binding transcriptional regulator n=1 Tax=Vallitalea guaymasensis TaxID=1185412 RepID=UPI00272DA5ED|nr:LacI family DNA-binding transcriptional regulator [Vallitalea guaymasensis]